jgi:thioredoxin-like negative regulator of GroEL
MLLQQQRKQQQQRSHAPPTAAEVQHSLEQRVEALKEQGNVYLKAGQLQEAESAYMEALQLDGDNAKVLLNLAQLRLAQKDGAGAVRAAEEVLGLQGVGEDSRRKATLRWVLLHRPVLLLMKLMNTSGVTPLVHNSCESPAEGGRGATAHGHAQVGGCCYTGWVLGCAVEY